MTPSKDADALYNRAIGMPRTDGARAELLQQALYINPQHGHSYLSLGADMRRSGRILASVELLRESARLMPGNPAAQHALGESLLAALRPVEALPHLEAALAANRSLWLYEYYRGKALLASYRVAEASSSLLRAKRLGPMQAIRTGRNDARLKPQELEHTAQRSVSQWANLAHTRAAPIAARSLESHARTITHRAHALEWVGTGEEEAGRRQLPLRICAVADASSHARLERALNDAAAVGAPVLLRNATALWDHDTDREPEVVSTSRLDELTTAARRLTLAERLFSYPTAAAEQPGQAAEGEPSMWLPVSLIFSNGTTNRMHTLSVEGSTCKADARESDGGSGGDSDGGGGDVGGGEPPPLSPHVREHLRRRGVDGALQRPLTQYMDVRSLLSLLRSGECLSRCYVKQVNPSLIIPNPNGRVPAALLHEAGSARPLRAAGAAQAASSSNSNNPNPNPGRAHPFCAAGAAQAASSSSTRCRH